MYIHSLDLMHFRGFKHLPIELNQQLNVFVGMNGAGKSSILDASAILLSWLTNRIKSHTASGRPVAESDIKNGESICILTALLKTSPTSENVSWNLAKNRKGYKHQSHTSILKVLNYLVSEIQTQITETKGETNIPLFIYYPVNRAVLDIPLRIREKHQFDLLTAYEGALTGGANFRTFFEWFRECEDLENEHRRYLDDEVKPDDFQFPNLQLEAVRHALRILMPEFTDLTVRRNPLRMEVNKNGKRLTVNQLSDGEKCLMAMVGDLARRMAIANPMRLNPLEGDGVVLIDEIDLHLHPKWQRRVLPSLLEVFPNCQFLISTHSPHVINHVKPEHLFFLNMNEQHHLEVIRPQESYGKTIDRVLEDLMGVEHSRPNSVENDIRQIYDNIRDGELEYAKNGIEALRNMIGDDPELAKAEVLIRRKELIGR